MEQSDSDKVDVGSLQYLEKLLQSDDANPGSFGAFEKNVAYALLTSFLLPILLVPFLFKTFKRSIYAIVAILSLFVLGLFWIVRFKFSWIVRLGNQWTRVIHG